MRTEPPSWHVRITIHLLTTMAPTTRASSPYSALGTRKKPSVPMDTGTEGQTLSVVPPWFRHGVPDWLPEPSRRAALGGTITGATRRSLRAGSPTRSRSLLPGEFDRVRADSHHPSALCPNAAYYSCSAHL